jgi:hypothetical protein
VRIVDHPLISRMDRYIKEFVRLFNAFSSRLSAYC